MIKFRHRRPPAWHPRKVSRLIGFLKDLRKHLTFRRIVLAVFVLPLLLYIYREVNHDALIIDPFSVPKRFEETGLTPEVVANRIADALRQIETSAQTRMKKDNLTSLHGEESTPDVEIPGTKLGLKTLVEVARAVLGIYPKHVSGDIIALLSTEFSSAKPPLKVTVYITQGRNRSRPVSLVVNTNDVDVLAQDTAKTILEQVNPYILAAYQYDHGEVNKAAELLQRIIQDPSEDRDHAAAAHNFLGTVLSDQNKDDEAVVKYKEAIKLNPKYADPYYNWALVLYGLKKYDEALAKYQKTVELDPKNTDAYNNWGNVLREQKKYDEAVAKYQRAIELDPKYALAYNNWGNALSDQNKDEEAVAKYQKAIELDSKYAAPYNNWGLVFYDQKRYDEAVAKYQKAIELEPKFADAYNNWGLVLKQQKKYDEAVAKYQRAIELDPKYALAYNNWGNVLREQKKYDEAVAKYQKAIELDSKYAVPYNNWGNVLREQKKYDEAVAKYQKAIELDPKDADAYNSWGYVLSDQKKYDEAKQKFARARELSK
jgi:tetratricopeptide (TPR) repeat protein